MSNKKRICIVSPSMKMGGIERALTVLANYFCNQGYLVSFISAQGGERFYELDERIQFFEPKLNRKSGFLGKVKVYYEIVVFIRKTVQKILPDAVLSFGDAFNPLVLLALTNTKFPVFISDRTSPDFHFNSIIRFGKKYLYPRSKGFIAQTKRAADFKIKKFDNKLNIKIIPNAIKEIDVVDEPKKNIIVSVGRLSYEKGHDRLIEAFAKLNGVHNWKLLLAGSGPLLEQLRKLSKDLDLFDRVEFLGKVQNIDRLLSGASIFVLPSRLEGFPNALCEAMSAGLPCICFDSIPTETIVENNVNGIVVEEGDIEQLASALKFLIENESERKRIGKNAIEIKNQLQVDKIGNQFLSFMFQ
ncbi:MAG: glycosyltransferase family 4 protein [Flavobacteriaceae bacterium]|nr:glycosyltransferase family 4 protein [Flavobacteriaceae bacterium]